MFPLHSAVHPCLPEFQMGAGQPRALIGVCLCWFPGPAFREACLEVTLVSQQCRGHWVVLCTGMEEALKALTVSEAAGTEVCSVRKCTEQLADGEGLQELIFPSLGFYQILKSFFFFK